MKKKIRKQVEIEETKIIEKKIEKLIIQGEFLT